MSRVYILLCSSLITALLAIVSGQVVRFTNNGRPVKSGTDNSPALSGKFAPVLSQGLCRDGWKTGAMKDFSGKQVPICFKVNPQPQTWLDAQATCRKDYGFLLKLDSRASINNEDLLTYVIASGITKFWSGMHTENEHLVWDDLIPNQVRPRNILNDSSLPVRPWRWENNMLGNQKEYCGQVNLKTESDNDDDRRRRRKRSPDDDNTDSFSNFDLSNMRNRFLNNAFGSTRSKSGFPATGAFQTMLSRTQMSDQLAELPRTSLGIQSEHQLPGSGLSAANLQNGGLSTDTGNLGGLLSNIESDGETSTSGMFGNTENNNGDQLNTGTFTSRGILPTSSPDLLSSVRNAALAGNLESLQNPSPTVAAVERLRDLIQGSSNNFQTESDNSEQNSASLNILSALNSENSNSIISSSDSNNENKDKSSSDSSKSSSSDGIDLSKLADMFKQDKQSSGDSSGKSDDSKPVIESLTPSIVAPSINPLMIPSIMGSGNIVDKLETVAENSKENIADNLGKLDSTFEKVVENMGGNMDNIVGKTIENVGENVGSIPEKVAETLSSNLGESLNPIMGDIGDKSLIGNVADTLEKIKETSGDSVSLNLDSLLEKPDSSIAEKVESITENLPKPLENLMENINEKIADNINSDNSVKIESVVGGSPAESVLEKMSEQIEEVKPEAESIQSNMADVIETAKENLNFEPEPIDIANAAVPVPNLEDVIEKVSDKVESVQENVNDRVESVQEISQEILPPIVSGVLPVLPEEGGTDASDVGEIIQEAVENVQEGLPDIETSPSLPNIISEATSEATERVGEILENIQETNAELPESTGQTIVSHNADKIDDITEDATEQTEELLPPPIIQIDDLPESITESISESVSNAIENVNEARENIGDIIEDRTEATQQIVSGELPYSNMGDSETVSDLLENVQETVQDLTGGDDLNTDRIDSELNDIPEADSAPEVEQKHVEIIDDIFGDNVETAGETLEPDTDRITDIPDALELPDAPEVSGTILGDAVDDVEVDRNANEDVLDVLKEYEMDGTDNVGEVQSDVNELDPFEGNFDDVVDSFFPDQEDTNDGIEPQAADDDNFEDVPSLSEDIIETARKAALVPTIKDKEMSLSSCETKLPSICFSYEVEILDKASTCEDGWYGHVLLDVCYKILDRKMSYSQAIGQCTALGGRLLMSTSEFERKFVLIAVQKEGTLRKDATFWIESPNDKTSCMFFSARGVHTMRGCSAQMNVVCVKDAKSLSVLTNSNVPLNGDGAIASTPEVTEDLVIPSRLPGNKLPCELTSAASEFPVLWFKDGVLVETKDKYVSSDLSLYLNNDLVTAVSTVLNRPLDYPSLQGRYWCEVWDRQTLTRRRSKTYAVRFSDVITFHGSMVLPRFTPKQQLLFNMMNENFPAVTSVEMDLKHIFADGLSAVKPYIPDVTGVFTFVDHVRSNPNVLEYHTYYTLNRDYTQKDESNVYGRLKSHLRVKLGNRNFMAQLPGQTPRQDFRTLSLQSTVSCPATSLQTNKDFYGHVIPVKVFAFPRANLGEFANSVDTCSSTNKLPAGTARCLGNFFTGAYWSDVAANECIDETPIDGFNNVTWGTSPFTDKLTQMAQSAVDARNVEKMVQEVAQITEVAQKFTPTDINKIADVLDHSTQVNKLSSNVGKDMLKAVDKLMAFSDQAVHVANVETKAANRIIKSLERYAENADIGKQDKMRFVSDNVVVEIWDLKPSTQPVIGLAAQSKNLAAPFKTEDIATVYNRSHLYDAKVDAAIELPSEVFNKKEKGQSMSDRLTMMVFRKSKLFDAAISEGGRTSSLTDQHLMNLNSYVISASIAGKKIQDLQENVRTIFKPLTDTAIESKCVWWDFDMNNFKGGWSSKGCVYDGKVNGRDVCLCNHLTNFAVLIDMYGQSERIPEHHELSLSIITVLGLSLSILGLALTIISYLFFRKLRQGRAQQTLFNLSLALLLSMLVFLVGIKQTHSDVVCKVVAILLHYLILVSFMWMLMEAILQYLTFVKILGTYITRFTLKTVVPAWGLPLIPIIAVLSVDPELYKGGPYYCWMALPAFYYAFVIPISCIILINVVIFFITVVSIFRRGKGLRSNQKKQKMAMTNLQAAITSFILLGLTWMFGYLAIADARLVFQYVFTILNSLQGFFIFVLFVLRKKKVREQWYFICCKGMEKDRVSRSLSASNSIPSTYSNGSNRNSRKTGRERDRSDSTKTVQSTYSNSSTGFTNYGYDHGYDYPFSRYDKRAFRKF